MKTRLLLVDDQQSILYFLRKTLTAEGFAVDTADTGQGALDKVEEQVPDVVLLDMKLPDINGLNVLRELRVRHPHVPVIMMTAFGDVHSSVEAMKLGAMDYLNKPVQLEELLDILQSAKSRRLASAPAPAAPPEPASETPAHPVIGELPPTQEDVVQELQLRARALVQRRSFRLLLEGEPGSGREALGRWAAANSPLASGPALRYCCAAIPEERHWDDLFTPEKGLLARVRGGVLLLDSIECLAPAAQRQLVEELESGQDFGLIVSSEIEVAREVEGGRMRAEIWALLAAVRLRVPPLRRRRADILPLAEQFLREAATSGKSPGLSASAREALLSHAWTGNMRELRSVMATAALLSQGATIEPAHLVLPGGGDVSTGEVLERIQDAIEASLPPEGIAFEELIEDLERSLIEKAYRASDGNQSQTAKLLNLNRDKLRYRMKSFQLL